MAFSTSEIARREGRKEEQPVIHGYLIDANPIGSGGFWAVYGCSNPWDDESWVMKIIPFNSRRNEANARKESATMAKLSGNEHVVTYCGAWVAKNLPVHVKEKLKEICKEEIHSALCIVMKRYTRTLDERIREGFDGLMTIWRLFGEIVMGIDHLHKGGYIHGDLSSNNILLDDGDRVKVANFGLAIRKAYDHGSDQLQDSTSIIDGNFIYHAPERFKRKVCQNSDIYQLGLILFEMIHPMSEIERIEAFQALKCGILPMTFSEPVVLKYMVFPMLCKDPDDRPNINDVITCIRGFDQWQEAGSR